MGAFSASASGNGKGADQIKREQEAAKKQDRHAAHQDTKRRI